MKKIVVLFLTAIIVLSGCTWFKKDPQKAVDEGIAQFADVKKMQSQLIIKGLVQSPAGETPQRIEFTVDSASKSDNLDEQSPKVETALKLDAIIDGKKGSGELVFRTVGKKMFANLAKIELPGIDAAAMQQELASVLNVWWSMPLGEGNPIGKITDEQKKLKEHFKTTKFFVNATEEGSEEIRGISATRYRVDLDKNVLKTFVLDVARSSENQLTPEEVQAVEDGLKNIEFSGAVWVGDDDIVHRINGTLTIRADEGPNSSFDIDYVAWAYNEDVDVIVPEGAKEFNPLLLYPMLGAFGVFDQGTTTGQEALGTSSSAATDTTTAR